MRSPERVYITAITVLIHMQYFSNTMASNRYANGVWSPYGIPVWDETRAWTNAAKPLEQMVDVVNEFGLKVLAEHNFLNDNNIAFSPYGLTGIMVALYEGVDGEAAYEIQRSMQLPWERKNMRIGFRDIHRTLKTYFVPESGFLAGLALSNENVTFEDSYKDVLRFYGFDLSNEQLPTLPPKNSTMSDDGANNMPGDNATTIIPTETTSPTRVEETSSVSSPPEDRNSPGAEETTMPTSIDVDIRQPTAASEPSSTANTETTTTVVPQPIQSIATGLDTPISSTPQIENTPPTTLRANEDTTTTSASIHTTIEIQTTSMPEEPTVNNEVEIITQVSTVESSTTGATSATITMADNPSSVDVDNSSTGSTADDMTVKTDTTNREPTPTMEQMTTLTDFTPSLNESTLETLERKKKSIIDFIYTNPSYVEDYAYYGMSNLDVEYPEQYRSDIFLANGLRSVQVSFMHYETILEHAFLPHLQASALRLPLDSPRYYLLVVLPTRAGSRELSLLLARLARESDLRDVHGALRPRRVRAVVPSFTVKGHVSLTTDLQKLGIRTVFEPRQRSFSPMTAQAGVYVRSVEQAVSVTIRKYQTRAFYHNDKYMASYPPVTFAATYPFVYFVMDSNIHVALMAGKIVDPLNTRLL